MRLSGTVLRTWALRGAAGFVLVFLVGAWAVGLARNGGDGPARDETAPAAPDSSLGPVAEPTPDSVATEPSETSASESADPSEAGTTTAAAEDSPGTVPVVHQPDQPGQPGQPDPAEPSNTVSTPRPSDRPTSRPTPTPTPSPTSPPTQECVGLANAIDCVLAPITSRP